MEIEKFIVILHGEDKTEQVERFEWQEQHCCVWFKNGKTPYRYGCNNAKTYPCKGRIQIDEQKDEIVLLKGQVQWDVVAVLDFVEYVRLVSVCRENGSSQGEKEKISQIYPKDEVEILRKRMVYKRQAELFDYFKKVAAVPPSGKEKQQETVNYIENQYKRLETIPKGSVLEQYLLNGVSQPKNYELSRTVIFPFGLNESQKKAVESALTSQVSIIQGPPGTGKTQTILNILANLVLCGKPVAVVSNNNSAVKNVMEKLQTKQLSFLTALLGRKENVANFLQQQDGSYPCMSGWQRSAEQVGQLEKQVSDRLGELTKKLEMRTRLAQNKKQQMEMAPERTYFQEYYEAYRDAQIEALDPLRNLNAQQVLSVWLEYERHIEQQKQLGIFKYLYLWWKFDTRSIKLFRNRPNIVIPYLKNRFYSKLEKELNTENEEIKRQLQHYDFDENMRLLSEQSMQLLYAELSDRYAGGQTKRTLFKDADQGGNADSAAKELGKAWGEFIKEYPIVLSSTHSICRTLNKYNGDLFDYVIVDESSQVDLRTAVLSLSCAKNVVIVGDSKQLPPVIEQGEKEKYQQIEAEMLSESDAAYRMSDQSLISSALAVWSTAPETLLREHYRCHPKIINFCNQKFYNNELVIMTEDHGEKDVLNLYVTVPGNHARDRVNQRQIDVIQQEVLPNIDPSEYEDVGIIAPYRDQVDTIRLQTGQKFEVATVHSFQGREKGRIIISSVDNRIRKFVDEPQLLNVAVSRAVRSLTVLISADPRNETTNYGNLMRYIQYSEGNVVQSKVYSVFDLLYHQYEAERERFLKKCTLVSEYVSEKLMYTQIQEILKEEEFSDCSCAVHVPLMDLIVVNEDSDLLTEPERRFICGGWSHVDFLVYRKMDKSPVIAIEVDGVEYHSTEKQKQQDRKIPNRH